MIEKIVLPNGARLVCEEMPLVRSAAVGFWIGSGSRHEPEELGGISHAIEHMVFKGAGDRTSAQIAAEMDAIGGQINAFTTKEATCYYGRTLDSHLDTAIGLLSDIFFRPKMAEDDWAVERGVILEEIGMYEDSPEDLVSETLFAGIYKDSSLGRPILGNADTLKKMTASDIASYRKKNYAPDKLVVSLAGHFSQGDKQKLIDMLSALEGKSPEEPPSGVYAPCFVSKNKQIEQNHLCLAFPGLPLGSKRRHAMQVLNGILGAGMSSRLFQAVREQNGLCYSIYSFSAAHKDTGVLGVYTALGKETEEQAIRLSLEVITEFAEHGPKEHELDRAREQIKANVMMSLESTSSRMNHLGQNELLLGYVPTPDEIIEKYDAVTAEGVRELAGEVFDFSKASFSAVGNIEDTDYSKLIKAF